MGRYPESRFTEVNADFKLSPFRSMFCNVQKYRWSLRKPLILATPGKRPFDVFDAKIQSGNGMGERYAILLVEISFQGNNIESTLFESLDVGRTFAEKFLVVFELSVDVSDVVVEIKLGKMLVTIYSKDNCL